MIRWDSRSSHSVTALLGVMALAATTLAGPAAAGGYIWLGAELSGAGSIYRFNIDSGIVDLILQPELPPGASHWNNMAVDGTTLYLGNPTTQYIGFADLHSGVVHSSGAYNPDLTGHKEDGAYDPSTGSMWRVTFSDLLYEITPAGNLVRQFVLPASTPNLIGLEWVGENLYATDWDAANPGHLGRIELTSDTTATFAEIPWAAGGAPPGGSPEDWSAGLAYDRQSDVLYLATSTSTRLFAITVAGGEATATLVTTLDDVGYAPGALADGMGWAPGEGSSVGETGASAPPFALQSWPDPFTESTTIAFTVFEPTRIRLEVWDVAGRRVRTLVADAEADGLQTVNWDGHDDAGVPVPSGVFFVRLTAGYVTAQGRVVRTR